jgi:lipoyl(octanoyl) transferase
VRDDCALSSERAADATPTAIQTEIRQQEKTGPMSRHRAFAQVAQIHGFSLRLQSRRRLLNYRWKDEDMIEDNDNREALGGERALQVYLLGTVEFDAALLLQRRLHFDLADDSRHAALVICEHPPLITVGRQGSRRHLLFDPEELQSRQWRIRWVNRAGGCWLHLPGQFSIYPILPLASLGLSVPEYVAGLGEVLRRVLDDFSVSARVRVDDAGVWVGNRLLAAIGVAVKNEIAYYGACFNLHPPLDLHRLVRGHPRTSEPMTSLECERRGPVRPSLVRERIVDHFRSQFGFGRVSLFSDHPQLHARQAPGRTKRALGVRN